MKETDPSDSVSFLPLNAQVLDLAHVVLLSRVLPLERGVSGEIRDVKDKAEISLQARLSIQTVHPHDAEQKPLEEDLVEPEQRLGTLPDALRSVGRED